MSNHNPLPPKKSMFWNDQSFSHDDAVTAYEQDGTLTSFNQMSDLESDDLAGSPPEHSMFWEGGTEKIEPPEQGVPEEKLNLKKKEVEGETINIVPVRYAIDEIEDPEAEPATKPFGLPEDWKGKGSTKYSADSGLSYTLRQLRDGWLYVYDHMTKELDEYEVKGVNFTQYLMGESEDPELGKDSRGQAQEAKPYITYSTKTAISCVFSKHRWSWESYERVRAGEAKNGQFMSTRALKLPDASDVGDIELLSQVADIEESAVEDQRFANSSVLTSVDSEYPDLEVKPVASAAEIKSALPPEEAACIMAIDDYLAEGRDVSAYFVGVASPYRLFEEQYTNQWALMQTAMQLCMFGSKDDLKMPSIVKRRGQELEFYKDLSSYYSSRNIIDIAKKNEAYPGQFNEINSELNKLYGSNMSSAMESKEAYFEEKYNVSPAKLKSYDTWAATDKWRKMLDWQRMFSEMEELTKKREELFEPVAKVREDFHKNLEKLSPHRIEWLMDLWDRETQDELLHYHMQIVEAVTFIQSEQDQEFVAAQFDNPTTIIPLNTSGFSRELFSILGSAIPLSIDDASAISADQQTESSMQDKFASAASNWGSATGIYSKLVDFLTNEDVYGSELLKPLSDGAKNIHLLIHEFVEALSLAAPKTSASFIAQSSVLVLSAVAPTATANTTYMRMAMAERLALKMGLEVPDDYSTKFVEWRDKIKRNEATLKESKAMVDAFNRNDKSVSKSAFKAAREKYTNAKKVLRASMLEYPQKIVLPRDFASAMANAHMDILKGKIDRLGDYYKSVGGLGFIGLLFNLISFHDALEDAFEDDFIQTDEYLAIIQTGMYSLSAVVGIRAGKAWSEALTGKVHLRRASLRALIIKRNELGVKSGELRKLMRFNKWLAVGAVIGLFATAIEGYRVYQKYKVSSGIERHLLFAQGFSLVASAGVLTIQTVGYTGFLSLSVTVGAFATGVLAVAVMIYVATNFLLEATKKDDYQKWLSELPWGRDASRKQWSTSQDFELQVSENSVIVEKALKKLQDIVHQPVVKQTPINAIEPNYHGPAAVRVTQTAIKVDVLIPNGARIDAFRIHSNFDLSTAENINWLLNKQDNQPSKYTFTLPIRQNEEYFTMKVEYVVFDNEPNSESVRSAYFYQNAVKNEVAYTSNSDEKKVARYSSNLTANSMTVFY
ncbi:MULTISPECIES: T6SS effector BTH_I2691 family protein [unclassified Vibrio]|uniref:T6SS effector BTH_I2691 family protein n=1 Tax=unclassified Vibrio TaxID=2614977 RepID=UPI002043B08E|nr:MULTISPECIES: T6SS effector BTH_I2691 family protein [unclassified Vibrio]